MSMPGQINIVKLGLLGTLLFIGCNVAVAQTTSVQAKQFAASKDFDKAVAAYGELYGLNPDSVYAEYLNTLIAAKKYKEAEQLVEKQMTLRLNPLLGIDLGCVLFIEGKCDKAMQQFGKVLQNINGDLMYTERMAKAFVDAGLEDYAIVAYEKTAHMINAPYYYGPQEAKLYVKCGNPGRAIDALLIPIPGQGLNLENVKAVLLELLGNDPDKLLAMQKALVAKINRQPDNAYYVDILTWIYTQKNDWDGALIQMEAIDERNKETGNHLFELARTAANAKQYETALKAYDDIIAKGKDLPYFVLAKSERLTVALNQLKTNPTFTPKDVDSVVKLYDAFLLDYPKHYGMQAGSDLAMVLAQYGNDVHRAIEILKKGIADPDIQRKMAGQFKLQLGDYYALIGQIWEASLTYSQVDKEFKQDALGEDARFRNAKLAYYRGDFDWAQHQLTILKSATSELISNDAIYLSVLITENVEDSNLVPLQRFAYAGLLVFQNKDKEAETLLDSINTAFPKHPLNDDIIMVRADMARKRRNYDKALEYLKEITSKYGQDVLGDDAVFKIAEIYQYDLHNTEQAKHYYEQLIIDYQGSTFVQTARLRLNELKNGTLP
jgi:predicted Zn-dependent protease